MPLPTRLSAAIRFFAGGSPDDIAICHGISNSEVRESAWMVIDAANKFPDFKIEHPSDHSIQRSIADGFKKKSKAGFAVCAGAIDCMLIWIEKPTLHWCDMSKCGAKRFCCGRKKKFGLQFQGACDAEGRFLDVNIGHPGSTSDCLAFITSFVCSATMRMSTHSTWRHPSLLSKAEQRMITTSVIPTSASRLNVLLPCLLVGGAPCGVHCQRPWDHKSKLHLQVAFFVSTIVVSLVGLSQKQQRTTC